MLPTRALAGAVVAGAAAIGWASSRRSRRAPGNLGTRTQAMLAAIAEQSSDPIIACTLDGTVIAWNSSAERLYGWTAAEVLGHHFGDLLSPDRRGALEQVLRRLAAGEHIHEEEIRRKRKDGTPLLVSTDVSPIRDRNGTVVAAAARECDVTERKQREAEEKAAMEQSVRAAQMESLGQLAGGVAHDFNNLLAIILNYTDFIADEVTGEAARDLSRIRDAADRARSLTGQLLLFAKRDPGRVEVVDLNDVVTGSTDLLGRTIGANIHLVARPRAGAIPVAANRGRLEQIMLNLVINARDAMPDGGVVVIETDFTEVTDGPEAPLPPGRYARLTVSDTGTGMSAEVRDRLFEPFFTTKPADRGTGLGLSTVYGIVGDAGGHIGVESEPGAGTTFRILLPPADSPAPPASAAPPGPSYGRGERVLVIEDEVFVRDVVVRILQENGYRTTTVGENSLDEVDLADVSLLVTDIVLPGRPGPEVAAELRLRQPDLRVLFMSGYSESELRRRYHIADSTRIVQKPFTAVELLATVGEALSGAPTVARPR
ncbi:hybrid sensor histidine kinase/response regulator [Actinoplanes flavus]|nr:PAS domain S-box protein [Actinoplanes flavus]